MDLAVAVVIGTAFTAVVNALVKDIITPLIASVGGEPNFGGLAFTINGSRFAYGDFLNAVLTFLIVAAVMFFLVIRPVNVLMEQFSDRARGRVADAAVPGVPLAHPARREPVRVLHDGGGGRRRLRPATAWRPQRSSTRSRRSSTRSRGLTPRHCARCCIRTCIGRLCVRSNPGGPPVRRP